MLSLILRQSELSEHVATHFLEKNADGLFPMFLQPVCLDLFSFLNSFDAAFCRCVAISLGLWRLTWNRVSIGYFL